MRNIPVQIYEIEPVPDGLWFRCSIPCIYYSFSSLCFCFIIRIYIISLIIRSWECQGISFLLWSASLLANARKLYIVFGTMHYQILKTFPSISMLWSRVKWFPSGKGIHLCHPPFLQKVFTAFLTLVPWLCLSATYYVPLDVQGVLEWFRKLFLFICKLKITLKAFL